MQKNYPLNPKKFEILEGFFERYKIGKHFSNKKIIFIAIFYANV